MSVYFKAGKGWRYDFKIEGKRYTKAWFQTKKEARQAEARMREELLKPSDMIQEKSTDMVFGDLVNLRLDHAKAYNSESHYNAYVYLARRWVKRWGSLRCSDLSLPMIQKHLLERRAISAYTANKDLRYLRATFNYGIKKHFIENDPTEGLDFFPVEKKEKYVPSNDDLNKVIECAEGEEKDYLIVLRETMARVGEINRLTWNDIDLKSSTVTLYTRKKSGGHLTPRRLPMTKCLHETLTRMYSERDSSKPWVFWHKYWSNKAGKMMEGPYGDRKKLMKRLCEKAGVRYFRFHPIRHLGASVMDNQSVPIAAIQRILGHENRKTTEIYLHCLGDLERNAMSVFEQARESHTQSHTQAG